MAKVDREMRILYVISSLFTGGAEVLVCNVVQRLRKEGYHVDLCVFNGEYTQQMRKLESNLPDIRIYKLGHSFYNILYVLKLIRIIKGYDIIHTHLTSPQLFVAIANIFQRKKLVTTEHSSNNKKRTSAWLRVIDRWMYSRYNSVICISEVAEKNLKDYLGSIQKMPQIQTINNGVDVEKINMAKPIDRNSVGCDDNKFVIVMVAGLRPVKDHDTLIKAMTHLSKNRFELWIVGDGERRSVIEQEIEELHVGDRIKMLGLRNDVPSVLKAADVVVMSSHWEGLSLSNIEGMSAGKPFIASEVDGLREVTQGYGILFPHGDDKALAEIILKLESTPQLYKEVAQRCYDRAKEFDISVTVREYISIYKKLVI